jgi:hypothetical protein
MAAIYFADSGPSNLSDCTESELQITSQGPYHAYGAYELDFFIDAHTRGPCLLASHPEVQLLDAQNRPLPTRANYPRASVRPISPVGTEISLLWKHNCLQALKVQVAAY